jgi:hypothetical protein
MILRFHDFIRRPRRAMASFVTALACLWAAAAAAHEVPADARLYGFAKPAGNTLEVLLRVPLASLTDVTYPLRNGMFIDVAQADQSLRDATKIWLTDNIDFFENGTALPKPAVTHVRVSLPSDRSFTTYEQARAHFDDPVLTDTDLVLTQQMMDVRLEYPIASDRSDFAIQAKLDRLAHKVTFSLRFLLPGGTWRAFELTGEDKDTVILDPRWHQAALRFVVSGFHHILDGIDHLLFLACLIIPFRRFRPLVAIVTAFTVAHSITLIASAFGFVPTGLWFPPLIETLIAATIVYMALENIVGSDVRRRWVVTFAFGLIHGFGFSFALRDSLQFAGDHLLLSLLAFNVGVELGQIAVLILFVPALVLLFKLVLPERIGVIILSALVAHTGVHWFTERGETLLQFPFPLIDLDFIIGFMRGLIAALVLAALLWLVNGTMRRWLQGTSAPAKDMAE